MRIVFFIILALFFTGPAYADQITGEGVALRIDQEFEEGKPSVAWTEYYIKHKGKHVRLDVKGHQQWATGAKLAANGSWHGKSFKVDSLEVEPVIEELSTGPKKIITILVNMGQGTFDQTSVNTTVGILSEMDAVYRESSYDMTSFATRDVALVDFGVPVADCNFYTIAAQADALVGDVTGYQTKMYLVPPSAVSGCTWLALGEIGAIGSDGTKRSWSTRNDLSAFTHEVGHNKGLHHASTDPENDGVRNREYGDTSSVMGYCCVIKRFSAVHVSRIGWNIPTDIGVSGEYTIPHLYSNDIGTILRVPRASGKEYYLSYRKAEGYDINLGSEYLTGVAVHYGSRSDIRSYYIDTLADGECLSDSEVEVCQTSHTGDTTTVTVDFAPPPPPPEPVCGNGVLEDGEACDDGNLFNGDGCNDICEIEPPPPPPPEPVCGNGVVESGEQCDDGNLTNGDGCDEFCQIEPSPPDECDVPGKPTMECWCKVRPEHRKCQ